MGENSKVSKISNISKINILLNLMAEQIISIAGIKSPKQWTEIYYTNVVSWWWWWWWCDGPHGCGSCGDIMQICYRFYEIPNMCINWLQYKYCTFECSSFNWKISKSFGGKCICGRKTITCGKFCLLNKI